MIQYLIKSLPANTALDSVELECTRKRDQAILLAKQYAKLCEAVCKAVLQGYDHCRKVQ